MGRPKKRLKSEFNPTIQHINAMAFCVHKEIKIYPEMIKENEFTLNIEIREGRHVKHTQSPRTYKEHEMLEPIYEIYLTYFLRMADEDIIKKSKENYISFANY